MILSILTTLVGEMRVSGKKLPPLGFGQRSFQNEVIDSFTFPNGYVHLDSPLTANDTVAQSGYVGRKFPVKILFLFKSELDWTPTQHDARCIVPARKLINQFIERCSQSDNIDSIENLSELEVYDLFDANTSGIILSVTIKPKNESSICLES